MTTTRQDAWSEDDDLLLAEVTLRHIREGSTQLRAFEEVGDRLNRTPAACGFRWNSLVRKKYESAIGIAKAQRQQLKSKGHKRYVPNAEADRIKDLQLTEMDQTEFSEESGFGTGLSPRISHVDTEDKSDSMTFDEVIRFLRTQKESAKRSKQLEKDLRMKEEELTQLKEEHERVKKELDGVQNIHEDYQALLKIMDRARKLAFLSEEEEEKMSFKMDRNGNLEKVDKE